VETTTLSFVCLGFSPGMNRHKYNIVYTLHVSSNDDQVDDNILNIMKIDYYLIKNLDLYV
jgi:hypothetical protein